MEILNLRARMEACNILLLKNVETKKTVTRVYLFAFGQMGYVRDSKLNPTVNNSSAAVHCTKLLHLPYPYLPVVPYPSIHCENLLLVLFRLQLWKGHYLVKPESPDILRGIRQGGYGDRSRVWGYRHQAQGPEGSRTGKGILSRIIWGLSQDYFI